jgi:hypothetical protein
LFPDEALGLKLCKKLADIVSSANPQRTVRPLQLVPLPTLNETPL